MMDRERVESLFEAALELEPERRKSFVAAACGENVSMRDAVLRLLAGHARAGVLDADPSALLGDKPPERVGAYRIVNEIGRGGMGIVYAAERDDGQFRRRAAIKVIRSSEPDLQERFLAERQLLAALDHPNVARLLDGGVTDAGHPFIVMEHVEGLPVDIYCDRMRLDVTERLRLFTVIARAVEFAHRNLIVHCDLKPSNILVTPEGTVKLLDFGVARLLNPALLWPARRGGVGMTFEYASPEQLRGETLATSSDVYTLGVLLYELLVGSRPHQGHEGSWAEHTSAVCEGATEKPSDRVARLARTSPDESGSVSAVARDRRTTPGKLSRTLRGDVDAIVVMALRTDPPGRYGSAELLAQDIERFLARRPVRAVHGSQAYVFYRFVRRHRIQVVAGGLALAGIVFGAAGALWQARVAQRERIRAEHALQRSEQVSDFLLGLFDSGDQSMLQGVVTGRDLVRRGTQRIDQLAGQPDVQARLLGTLGNIFENLGDYEQGRQVTERALHLLGPSREDSVRRAALLGQLGMLMRRQGQYDSAQTLFYRALAMQQLLLDPGDPILGRTHLNTATIAIYLGDFGEAERRARASIDLLREQLGESHRSVLNLMTQLGAIQRSRGDRAGAEQTLRRAIQLRARSTGSTRFESLNDRFQLATLIQRDTARAAEAEALFRAELPLLKSDVPEDLYFLTWGEGALAELAAQRGDMDQAEELRRRVLSVRLGMLGPDHPSVAESTLLLGQTVLRRGRVAEAERLLREAAATYRNALGDRHPSYANVLYELSQVYLEADNLAAADSAVTLALAIRLDRYGRESHGYLQALHHRAHIQTQLRRFSVAEALLNECLELAHLTAGSESAVARSVHVSFVQLYTAWGKPGAADSHRAALLRTRPG